MALTRRNAILLALSPLVPRPWLIARAQEPVREGFELERFMRVSRVLTGVDDLADESSGRRYLAALLGQSEGASLLTALWRIGGFEAASPPASVADLVAAGVYERTDLRQLADTITGNWYSGVYVTLDGKQAVATYTRALAWRALGYRPGGPSACGGAFGHWANAPDL